tara:strand:+ start:817 stop:2184 length:1368 start_codon:yes stop_codon:yes gene_type:complete
MNYPDQNKCTVAIIGLGYVGLPLAVEFAKLKKSNTSGELLERKIIGFDINNKRIEELKKGFDRTNEISKEELNNINFYNLTSEVNSISKADVFIVAVPTPINELREPNLNALENACITVGKALKIRINSERMGNQILPIIIFESTVFPGTTEEICIPLIEKESGLYLKNNVFKDFFAFGYSPERINPGDKQHTLLDIKKVTSGNNKDSAKWIKNFYASVITAGVHEAESIKVAEAAKIIENTQRDLNIALVNEFAIIFKLMGIDTLDVINAASSKWNFLSFKPGLVGGHCIGVDPYYLTYKAKQLGYYPEVVLAGRKINDGMSKWVVDQIILEIAKRKIIIDKTKILLLGLTFKENCPDTRNTKVIDIINYLKEYNADITIVDPLINCNEINQRYKINSLNAIPKNTKFSVIICLVAHKEFIEFKPSDWEGIKSENGFFFDLKGFIPREFDCIRP